MLRQPLRDLAGGSARVEVAGSSVGEALKALEREHPKLRGWVLNEQGEIRAHVNVFVDGERATADKDLASSDELNIIQAISGGGF